MENRVVKVVGASWLVVHALAGCAGSTIAAPPPPAPTTVIAEARAQIDQAGAAGYGVEDARLFLQKAEQASSAGDATMAIANAEAAKRSVSARKAIDQAKPVVARAVKTAGVFASDASKVLDAAEAALKAGDPVRASELAFQARQEADSAVERKRSESRSDGGSGGLSP